jgi:hypothetical protein
LLIYLFPAIWHHPYDSKVQSTGIFVAMYTIHMI